MTVRRALVTGGNRGIGLAVAKGLAAAGLDVTIGARDTAAGEAASREAGCSSVLLDVEDASSIAAALSHAGPFDVLINNAGVLIEEPMLQDPAGFDRSMAVMLRGPYELIRLSAPAMIECGYGRIVNISSDWGSFSQGLGGPGAYGVAKAALNALTLAISRELPATVKVNAMCPGWVRTGMGGPDAGLTPEEAADTAIWLATLPPDGPTGGFFRERKWLGW